MEEYPRHLNLILRRSVEKDLEWSEAKDSGKGMQEVNKVREKSVFDCIIQIKEQIGIALLNTCVCVWVWAKNAVTSCDIGQTIRLTPII